MPAELDHLQEARAEHDGNREEECEFRRHIARRAEEDAAQDRRARARSTRHERQHLKQTDDERRLVVEPLDLAHARRAALVVAFDDEEHDAVEDQGRRYDRRRHEVLLHELVEQESDDRRRHAGENDFVPEPPCITLLPARLPARKRIELLEVQHDDGKDGTELYDDEEHVHKGLRYVKLDELIDEDHMPRAADRQPLCQTFDNAQNHRFQKLHNT